MSNRRKPKEESASTEAQLLQDIHTSKAHVPDHGKINLDLENRGFETPQRGGRKDGD